MDNAQPSSSVRVTTNRPKTRPWNFASQIDVGRFIALVKRHPKLQTRITPERLLPEWEKLQSVTGISAKDMCAKWKRLCDKYRTELRREMITTPDKLKQRWIHFEQMSFVREIEQKRIRLHKGVQKPSAVEPMRSIKVEPGSPPSSPLPKANPTRQKRLILKKQVPLVMPMKSIKVEPTSPPTSPQRLVLKKSMQQARGGESNAASCSYAKPAQPIDPHQKAQFGKLVPIERMPSTGRVKVLGCNQQNILEDLQEQAERAVASHQPVHRVPVTHPLVRSVPDNDYDFLMIRIHPLLALLPVDLKPFCYESVQQFIVRLFEVTDQGNRKTKRPMV